MQAVELPSSYEIATRGALPASYGGRPSFSTHSRPNRTRSYTTRKGSSPSRGSPRASPQKRSASSAVKIPSPLGDEGDRGGLQQSTARSSSSGVNSNSSSITAVQSAAGAHYPKTRHNSSSSSKSHGYRQQQG
jgi:hypothetical protein